MKIALITTYLIFIGAFACSAQVTGNMKNNETDMILKLLISAPVWDMIDKNDDAARDKITTIFTMIAHYDTASIRAAAERYVQYNRQGPECPFGDQISIFNLMALNRFVFNVPEFITEEEFSAFSSYLKMYMPREGNKVWILWPLSKTSDGKVKLTALFCANSGPLPDPLTEFDRFEAKFGRRFESKENPQAKP
jgi:hypothetical protein